MKTVSKELSVRLNGRPAGSLIQTTEGRMRFKYLHDASMAISLSLPIQPTAFSHKACDSYFDGLLPESSNARNAIGQQFNANPNSTFSLLKAIGKDCAGAISFEEINTPVTTEAYAEIRVRPMTDKEIERHIEELPLKPLFLGVDGLRLSLAGVQDKAAVFLNDGSVCLPLDGIPTSHILKPENKRFPALVQNEYLCMKTAQALGLKIPKVEMRKAGSQTYLLVERYDREIKEGKVTRIHQEDFCQALGNRKKYQRFGGPNLKKCFELLMNSNLPARDRNQLMEAVVFNFLIGNADAHGKNFSLLHMGPQNSRLAPFYDIVCTRVYPYLTTDLSMKIGASYNFRSIGIDNWQLLAKQVGFSFPAIRRILKSQISAIPKIIRAERERVRQTAFDAPLLDEIVKSVTEHCTRTDKILASIIQPDENISSFSGSLNILREKSGDYYSLILKDESETLVAESRLLLEEINKFLVACNHKPLKPTRKLETFNIDVAPQILKDFGFISL